MHYIMFQVFFLTLNLQHTLHFYFPLNTVMHNIL